MAFHCLQDEVQSLWHVPPSTTALLRLLLIAVPASTLKTPCLVFYPLAASTRHTVLSLFSHADASAWKPSVSTPLSSFLTQLRYHLFQEIYPDPCNLSQTLRTFSGDNLGS